MALFVNVFLLFLFQTFWVFQTAMQLKSKLKIQIICTALDF